MNALDFLNMDIPQELFIACFKELFKGERLMKLMKSLKIALFAVFCTLLLSIAFVPIRAKAYTKIDNGATITMNKSGAIHYKMVIEKDCYLQLSWANNTSKLATVTLYADKGNNDQVHWTWLDTEKGKEYVSLKAGTYFVEMGDSRQLCKIKFSWTPAYKLDQGNYCVAKAKNLSAGTTVNVAQTPTIDYTRWYKIKLTKNQKVTIKTPYGYSSYVSLYSPSWQSYQFNTNSDGTQKVTTDKLTTGNYFIAVRACNSYTEGRKGVFISFSWK